ncbi:MAG: N,N-dimethylformamidase beta subunit family domain-containing protein [Pseudomonadota bacterium]|nr:N,N-dimethylformamidase beta subunit family domain-containing protein [Pseudomonadota bacterium]
MTEFQVDNPTTKSTNAWNLLDYGKRVEFPSTDPAVLEIWAYTDRMSYRAGDTVALHVHTTANTFHLEVFRDGPERVVVLEQEGVRGFPQETPANAFEIGCDWDKTTEFVVDPSWQSGVYVAILKAVDEDGIGIEREAFFVVRTLDDRPNKIVFVLPTPTYVAYNDWGGANAYRSIQDGQMTDIPSPTLSLNRPWARGIVRLPKGAPRYSDFVAQPPGGIGRYPWIEWALAYGYSRHYADAGWANYDRPFAMWLERAGHKIDYLTLHDLHDDPSSLDNYALMVITGHDEYWTAKMRDAVDAFVSAGGNLARFGGNFLWQVRYGDETRTQICYKAPNDDPVFDTDDAHLTSTMWDAEIVNRPGAQTVGLSGLSGVYARLPGAAPRHSGALTVYKPEHWVFEDTDLYYADNFGGGPSNIVSFEVDGADYQFKSGRPYPTGRDGVDLEFEILAMTPTGGAFEEQRTQAPVNAPADEIEGMGQISMSIDLSFEELSATGSCAMGLLDKGKGLIFCAGCSEWVSGLIHRDVFVEQITQNVISRLADAKK